MKHLKLFEDFKTMFLLRESTSDPEGLKKISDEIDTIAMKLSRGTAKECKDLAKLLKKFSSLLLGDPYVLNGVFEKYFKYQGRIDSIGNRSWGLTDGRDYNLLDGFDEEGMDELVEVYYLFTMKSKQIAPLFGQTEKTIYSIGWVLWSFYASIFDPPLFTEINNFFYGVDPKSKS